MKPEETATAAELIWRNWQAGTTIETLPAPCRPRNRAEGYAIQARCAAHSPNAAIGWKIAATSKAGQSHIGVSGPLAGRLLAERAFRSGATLPLAGNRMLVAEPEFAFRVGMRMAPRSQPYAADDAVAAMSELIPAIEVPDSRFADFATAGEAQLIADLACAHLFVLGAPVAIDWRQLDLASHPVKAQIGTTLERDGIGSNVLGDPRLALAWLVNEVTGLGLTLEPGEIITTGTSMVPLPIGAGDHVIADFGVLGRVEARFA